MGSWSSESLNILSHTAVKKSDNGEHSIQLLMCVESGAWISDGGPWMLG